TTTTTRTNSTNNTVIIRLTGTQNIAEAEPQANVERSTPNIQYQVPRVQTLGVERSTLGVFLLRSQIASISARSTSPSRLPCLRSSSSNRLNRATNLSVAFCNALSASISYFRARLTTANRTSPIS